DGKDRVTNRRPESPRSPAVQENKTDAGATRAPAGMLEARRSAYQHVLELPGIASIDVLGEQLAAADQRRPVGVVPDHRAEIGPLDVEAAAEIHLVGLHDAPVGIFQHTDASGGHRPGYT